MQLGERSGPTDQLSDVCKICEASEHCAITVYDLIQQFFSLTITGTKAVSMQDVYTTYVGVRY